jgi:hypothetical protein
MTGIVYSARVPESYILVGDAPRGDGYKPVRGAKIYLAFDKEGWELVQGFEAESGLDGRYKIEAKNIPPPKSPDEGYYLIVRKEGYMPLVQPIVIGSARFIRNTVILAPLSEDRLKGKKGKEQEAKRE